jgi:hypothetical protein
VVIRKKRKPKTPPPPQTALAKLAKILPNSGVLIKYESDTDTASEIDEVDPNLALPPVPYRLAKIEEMVSIHMETY